MATAGDGFLVRFDSPSAAVHCAIDVQRELGDDRVAGGTSPNIRIELVADHLDDSIKVEDRGLRPLKGVTQPRHLLAVRWA